MPFLGVKFHFISSGHIIERTLAVGQIREKQTAAFIFDKIARIMGEIFSTAFVMFSTKLNFSFTAIPKYFIDETFGIVLPFIDTVICLHSNRVCFVKRFKVNNVAYFFGLFSDDPSQ